MKVAFISTVPAKSLALAAQEIRTEFGLDLDLKIYYPRTIDEEEVDEELLKEDLKRSDAVFIDIRGEGHASEVVYNALKDEKNIVVNLSSPFSRMMRITRLGSFSGSRLADRIKTGEVRDPEEVWKKIQGREPDGHRRKGGARGPDEGHFKLRQDRTVLEVRRKRELPKPSPPLSERAPGLSSPQGEGTPGVPRVRDIPSGLWGLRRPR
jgi:hypothetical protein